MDMNDKNISRRGFLKTAAASGQNWRNRYQPSPSSATATEPTSRNKSCNITEASNG